MAITRDEIFTGAGSDPLSDDDDVLALPMIASWGWRPMSIPKVCRRSKQPVRSSGQRLY